MEEGYGNTKLIFVGKLHAITNGKAVINYVVMSKHNAFWETGGTRSILHIYNVIRMNGILNGLEFGIAPELTGGHCRVTLNDVKLSDRFILAAAGNEFFNVSGKVGIALGEERRRVDLDLCRLFAASFGN